MHWVRRTIVATTLTLLAVGAMTTTAAAAKPGKELRALSAEVEQKRAALGPKTAKRLARELRGASAALRSKKTCRALNKLGRFVEASTSPQTGALGAGFADDARELQRELARGKRPCGKTRVRVSPGLKPSRPALPPLAEGGAPRPVAAVEGPAGRTEFAVGELVLSTTSQTQLKAFLSRTGGKLIASAGASDPATKHGAVHLVRLPAGKAKVAKLTRGLAADLRRIDSRARGTLKVGSTAGLRTLAEAADESGRGLHVAVNWVTRSHASVPVAQLAAFPGQRFLDGATIDQSYDYGQPSWNAFDKQFLTGHSTDYDFGVPQAWQNLEVAGRLTQQSVDVAVIDGGFTETPELPGGQYQTTKDGPESGKERHGYFVSQVVGAIPDNGLGAAGTGGPVARVRGVYYDLDGFSAMASVYDAIDTGARIINMSFGGELDALISFNSVPYEDATQEAAAQGRLLIASAGNDSRDVDGEDCFFVCWEEEWIAPCENDGVLCVGGLFHSDIDNVVRHPESNYGFESCGSYDCTVKLFAPYNVQLLNLAGTGVQGGKGTSFSAPYVAGVAALLLAADPTLGGSQLRSILLETAHEFELGEILQKDKHPQVPRWIDAEAAVLKALKPAAPLVGIMPIENGAYSTDVQRDLRAIALVADDQGGCCAYHWRSDRDGFLGTGDSIKATFDGGPGTRTITVTATSAGMTGERSVQLDLSSNAPKPVIANPADGATLYKGIRYKLEGSWTDADQGIGTQPCDRLSWTVDRGSGTPTTLAGCQPEITFGINGPKTVTLTATDADGRTGSVVHEITVTDPPLNAPPTVQILSPDNGEALDPHKTYTLRGEATDPDGTGPISYEWTLEVENTSPTVLSTEPEFGWKPSTHVGSSCGGRDIKLTLKATDPDGSATDETTHHVHYPPC